MVYGFEATLLITSCSTFISSPYMFVDNYNWHLFNHVGFPAYSNQKLVFVTELNLYNKISSVLTFVQYRLTHCRLWFGVFTNMDEKHRNTVHCYKGLSSLYIQSGRMKVKGVLLFY